MISTIKKVFVVLLLLFTVSEVSAGWAGCRLIDFKCVDYNIADIFSEVRNNRSYLHGNVNNTFLQDFKEQRTFWIPLKDNTALITDGVKDIMQVLPPLREEFFDFIGNDINNKCSYGSTCYIFREELEKFFTELNSLKSKFPAFEKAGLVDTDIAVKAINATPPFLLYSMYKVMSKQPKWKDLPADLSDIYDEMDDPDIFSLNLADSNENVSLNASSSARDIPAVSDSTKTQRFCARRANKFDGVGRGRNGNRDGWDQIRINRITLVVTLVADIWKFGLDLVPDDIDIGVSLVGEGGTLGIPSAFFTYFIKAVPIAIESILKAIDVHHNNIGLCTARFSEIESRLSSCGYFTDFALDKTAQGEYYNLVTRRFEMADEAGIAHSQSDELFNKSNKKLEAGKYAEAFRKLCDSYSSIGIAK